MSPLTNTSRVLSLLNQLLDLIQSQKEYLGQFLTLVISTVILSLIFNIQVHSKHEKLKWLLKSQMADAKFWLPYEKFSLLEYVIYHFGDFEWCLIVQTGCTIMLVSKRQPMARFHQFLTIRVQFCSSLTTLIFGNMKIEAHHLTLRISTIICIKQGKNHVMKASIYL